MRKLKSLKLFLLISIIVGIAYTAPRLFISERWHAIAPGMTLTQVHAILGFPDIPFPDKQFDGWFNPFGYGASTITVRYTTHDRVASVNIKHHFGWEYKNWMQAYKQFISDKNP